jgi:hypothetical protein
MSCSTAGVSKKLIDACNAKGFHVIASIKTNRMMYPAGSSVKVSDFAHKYIRRADIRSVTVGTTVTGCTSMKGISVTSEMSKFCYVGKTASVPRKHHFAFCVPMAHWMP